MGKHKTLSVHFVLGSRKAAGKVSTKANVGKLTSILKGGHISFRKIKEKEISYTILRDSFSSFNLRRIQDSFHVRINKSFRKSPFTFCFCFCYESEF